MRRIRTWLMIMVIGAVQSQAQSPAGTLTARIDSMAAAALTSWPAVGLSIAVVRGGDTIVMRGYGRADLEHDVPATAQTVYRIGSITKQFTAVAILQLIEQGKLTLDDTIQRFLPDFPAQGNRVTIRHLLTHTSGIKSYTSLGPEWQDKMRLDLTHAQLVALFRDKPFDFAPGARFLYDNSGYYLLGMIVERVSGLAYAEYLNQRLFTPLGLRATAYCDDRTVLPHRASGYELDSGTFVNASPLDDAAVRGRGAVLHGRRPCGVATEPPRPPPDQRRLVRPDDDPGDAERWIEDDVRLRLGVGTLDGHRRIGHGGGINGFLSILDDYPDDSLSVVVLANSESARPGRLAQEIARVVLGAPAAAVADLPLGAADRSRFAGTYALGPLQVRVFETGGRLQAQATGQSAFGLRWQGDSTFVAAFDDDVRLVFQPAGQPQAKAFVLYQGGITQTATRLP
jgi:CubicO group peptidase (beta-lactamase class C family)